MFSHQISEDSILIAGGHQDETKGDSFIFNIKDETLRKIADLPKIQNFQNKSTTVVGNELYTHDRDETDFLVYKFSIKEEVWSKSNSIKRE